MLVTRYLCFLGVDLKSISQFFSERYVWRGLPHKTTEGTDDSCGLSANNNMDPIS